MFSFQNNNRQKQIPCFLTSWYSMKNQTNSNLVLAVCTQFFLSCKFFHQYCMLDYVGVGLHQLFESVTKLCYCLCTVFTVAIVIVNVGNLLNCQKLTSCPCISEVPDKLQCNTRYQIDQETFLTRLPIL